MKEPNQSFKMALGLTESFDENAEHLNTWYNDIPETKQELLEGFADGELVKPVSLISFDYPYDREQRYYFKENQPTTKHELFKRILAEFSEYLNTHPYCAPHAIEDFVIEYIDIYQFNDSYAEAYLTIGS